MSSRRVNASCALFGLAALMLGVAGQSVARADDGYRYDRRDRIETDKRILREDEEHMRRLQHRLDDETRNRDWHAARETRHDIDRTQRDIDQDHRNLDRDYHR